MWTSTGVTPLKSLNYTAPISSSTDKLAALRDERISKLKIEVRDHIRALNDYEIFSHSYCVQIESIVQIANVALLPLNISMNNNQSHAHQHNTAAPTLHHQYGKKQSGTLWDQQHDELILRILMEEGKLNLLIRMLYKLKDMQYHNNHTYQQLIQKWGKSVAHNDLLLCHNKVIQYESSLNTLIKQSLLHVEAVQVVDMPQYIALIDLILSYCIQNKRIYAISDSSFDASELVNSDGLSEHAVINYLYAIAHALDDINESNIYDLMNQSQILDKLIQHITMNYSLYSLHTLTLITHVYQLLCGSEIFSSQPLSYIGTSADQQKLFLTMKYIFVDELLSKYNTIKKRDIIKFYDQLMRLERQYGKSIIIPLNIPLTVTNNNNNNNKNTKTSIIG